MVTSNSINNTVGSDDSGLTNTFTTQNTSNTANSSAVSQTTIGGTTALDCIKRLAVGSAHSWALITTGSAGDQLFCYYADNGTVTPATSTNLPWRIDSINTVSGSSRMLVRSVLVVVNEGTGVCRLEINTGNSAGIDALIQMIQTNGTDDARIAWNVGSGANWNLGTDGSAGSEMFMTNAAVGSWPPAAANTFMKVTKAGEFNFPLNPAFLSTLDAGAVNVTGAGAVHTGVFSNEIFDQNNDFDGTSTFTAPVSGRYRFTAYFLMTSVGTSDTGVMTLVTSNRSYRGTILDPGAIGESTADAVGFYVNALCDMDAADTATVTISLNGAGGNTVDIAATSAGILQNYFCGELVA